MDYFNAILPAKRVVYLSEVPKLWEAVFSPRWKPDSMKKVKPACAASAHDNKWLWLTHWADGDAENHLFFSSRLFYLKTKRSSDFYKYIVENNLCSLTDMWKCIYIGK